MRGERATYLGAAQRERRGLLVVEVQRHERLAPFGPLAEVGVKRQPGKLALEVDLVFRPVGRVVEHGVGVVENVALGSARILTEPAEIFADQQLAHLCVMSALHGDGTGGEAVSLGERDHLGCMVVGHQKISGEMLALRKQSFVVDLGMGIKATASALPASGVGRVYKKDGIGVVAVLSERGKGVALHEGQAVSNMGDVADAAG